MFEGRTAAAAIALVLLASCGPGEVILPGERLDVRTPIPADETVTAEDGSVEIVAAAGISDAEAGKVEAGARAVPVSLPGQRSNSDWTQRGGNAQHFAGHVALGQGSTRVWSANIGRGSSRKSRLPAEPIVAGGVVYTLDTAATLTATTQSGGTVWTANLTPPSEKGGDASSGGLAAGEGLVFATTGYGELVAVNPQSGAVAWRQRFDAGVGSPPTVDGGAVYVAVRDGTGAAVRASDGKVLWQVAGAAARSGVTGGSPPLINGKVVIFPQASGQLLAVDRETGAPVWQAFVSGARSGRAYAAFSDLTGVPVLADGTIYAGSAGGRLGAVFADSGQAQWSAPDGAGGPVQVAGGQLFLVNDEDQLVRLDASTGAVVWRIDLPYYTKEKDRRRKGVFVHYGPVLAGGRLWTASTDGYLRAFDPASGAVVGAAEIPGGAASAPVVAGGTLYVLSQNGQLHAFR